MSDRETTTDSSAESLFEDAVPIEETDVEVDGDPFSPIDATNVSEKDE